MVYQLTGDMGIVPWRDPMVFTERFDGPTARLSSFVHCEKLHQWTQECAADGQL